MAQSENAFAVDLYAQLRTQPGNLFFSPYSISTALSMVLAGAKGQTAEEIAHVLHLNLLANDTNSLAPLLQDVEKRELFPQAIRDEFTLNTANALWGAASYSFSPSFIANIKSSFGGTLEQVDFTHPEEAANLINTWVYQQTKGKISYLIPPNGPPRSTRMILTNAIYFKAEWDKQFSPSNTVSELFHVSPVQQTQVEMMHLTSSFHLTAIKGARALRLPYSSNAASMVIILPDSNTGLAEIEASLTPHSLNSLLSSNQSADFSLVALSLPKIKTTNSFELSNILRSLGMKLALDPADADLTGIADVESEPIYISDVIHKAFIEVDENGTEAAAATAIMARAAGFFGQRKEPVPVPFVVDHPFMFLIRANYSGDILFMGRVVDPAQE